MIKMGQDVSNDVLAESRRRYHSTLKLKIYRAENESDVRQYALTYLGLDTLGTLEKHRVDWAHEELWLEFKYSANFEDRRYRAKVIAQMLHYMHNAWSVRDVLELPDSFGIIDKSTLMLYTTNDFMHYILDARNFKDIKSPSAPHPALEDTLFADAKIHTKAFNLLTDYELIWSDLEKRGVHELQ